MAEAATFFVTSWPSPYRPDIMPQARTNTWGKTRTRAVSPVGAQRPTRTMLGDCACGTGQYGAGQHISCGSRTPVCAVRNIRGIVVWNLIGIHCRAEHTMSDSLVEQSRLFGRLPSPGAA